MAAVPPRAQRQGSEPAENVAVPNADGASSNSHASQARSGAGLGRSASGSAPPQPLTLADVLARCNGDHVVALDQVLAERNQFALEAAKLTNENVRIWNLMGRIRKENETMKARILEADKASTPTSSRSNILPGSPAGARRRLPGSSENDQAGSPVASPRSTKAYAPNLLDERRPSSSDAQPAPPSIVPSGLASSVEKTESQHSSTNGNGLRLVAPSEGPSQDSNSTFAAHQSTSTPSSSATPISSVDQGAPGSVNAVDLAGAAGAVGNSQQTSIMQQRAAAQAQSRALSRAREGHGGRTDSLASVESGDYEAVEPSSASGTDDGINAPVDRTRSRPPPLSALDQQSSVDSAAYPSTPHTPTSRMMNDGSTLVAPPSQRSTTSRSFTDDRPSSGSSRRASRAKDLSRKMLLSPRLDASLLRVVALKIAATNYRLAERGREAISFFITVEILQPPASWGIGSLATGDPAPPTFWTLEKNYGDIVALDAKLRQKFGKKTAQRLAPLPDKNLFKDHAPAKVDQRKALLEIYLQSLLVLELPDKDYICTFLCTDVVPNLVRDPHSTSKDGFLTKKGQNLGRWVTRFYVLRNSILNYYETRGGAHIGSINLKEAQIGRQQSRSPNDADENSYRHAFLILEKRSGTPEEPSHIARHVLCAESEEERDDWVDVLVRAIGEIDNPSSTLNSANARALGQASSNGSSRDTAEMTGGGMYESASTSSTNLAQYSAGRRDVPPASPAAMLATSDQRRGSTSRKDTADSSNGASNGGNGQVPPFPNPLPSSASYRSLAAAEPRSPVTRTAPRESQDVPSSPASKAEGLPRPKPAISGPMHGAPIPTGYKFGAKDESALADNKKDDKKRFWHRFGGSDKNASREAKPVFGVPLTESIAISSIQEGLELPSVVYRCIEYLEKRNAALEEGIYRLSGSSAVIKTLKDRFNAEGDVDLLAGDQYFDPHAIAGLLKTFLRELPTSVLTRDLHLEFMRANEIPDRTERVNELGHLVSMLPLANYSLLRTLCSHLIKVIEHQDVNKMTMRNVGIVFSPTLGIGAGVFALFLTEFDNIFFTDAKGEPAPRVIEEDILAPEPSELGLSEDSHATRGNGAPKVRSKRNSIQYRESQAERLLGLEGRRLSSREEEDLSAHPNTEP